MMSTGTEQGDIGVALEKALEQVQIGVVELMRGASELADELSAMTEHYVQLAGCGDCGNWDPEKEPEVISARAKLDEFADAKRYFDALIAEGLFTTSENGGGE